MEANSCSLNHDRLIDERRCLDSSTLDIIPATLAWLDMDGHEVDSKTVCFMFRPGSHNSSSLSMIRYREL